MDPKLPERLRAAIRNVPDFPKPGILFRDITTFLVRPDLLREAVEAMGERFAGRFDAVAGIESRGFILGAPLAVARGVPFVPLRKPGKLPAAVYRESYASSTAPTRWKCIATPLLPARAFSSWMTCSPPAAPRSPRPVWSRPPARSSPGSLSS